MTTPNIDFNETYTDEFGIVELGGNFTVAPTIEAFFDGDLLLHPFWIRYRPMIENIPPIVHYILGIYIAIVGFIGITGNALVIYMFAVNKSLRTPSNMFIINLAISDLGFSAVNGFPLMTISCFMRKWYFGKIACELYAFFGGLFGFNSINTLAWISYDRMFVISKPFEAMRKSTMKRSALQLIFVWGWALLWSVPPLVGWGAYIPEGFMTSCSFDYLTRDTLNQTYVWAMFGGGFVAPVLMIIYCYTIIIKAISSQAKMMNKTAEKMGAKAGKDAKAKKQEIALAKVAAVTIMFFMLSWLPYSFVAMGAMAGYEQILTPYTGVIPVLFAKASAMWNPILYALSHPRFRAALDELFPSLVLCRGLCMDKGGDDAEAEDSDDGKGKGARKGQRRAVEQSSMSEMSDVGESSVSGMSSANETSTKVQLSPLPQRRDGAPSRPRAPPSNYNQQHRLQPQDPRVPPSHPPVVKEPRQSRSFRSSIGRVAGEAYKNLIDAYVGLKNVTDKLADKRAQMALEEHHPAASRRSSTVTFENPAYQSNVLPSPGAAPVYSVPVVYQQGAVPPGQVIGMASPAGYVHQEYMRAASPVQFIQIPAGAAPAGFPPNSGVTIDTVPLQSVAQFAAATTATTATTTTPAPESSSASSNEVLLSTPSLQSVSPSPSPSPPPPPTTAPTTPAPSTPSPPPPTPSPPPPPPPPAPVSGVTTAAPQEITAEVVEGEGSV